MVIFTWNPTGKAYEASMHTELLTEARLIKLEKDLKQALANQAYLESLLYAVVQKTVDPKNLQSINNMAESARQSALK